MHDTGEAGQQQQLLLLHFFTCAENNLGQKRQIRIAEFFLGGKKKLSQWKKNKMLTEAEKRTHASVTELMLA